jgi:protein subunit release factor A
LQSLLQDPDAAVRREADEEAKHVEGQCSSAAREVLLSLLPQNEDNDRPVMLEVRAGAGGDEASIFAGQLFAMYQAFAGAQCGSTLLAVCFGSPICKRLQIGTGNVCMLQRSTIVSIPWHL